MLLLWCRVSFLPAMWLCMYAEGGMTLLLLSVPVVLWMPPSCAEGGMAFLLLSGAVR